MDMEKEELRKLTDEELLTKKKKLKKSKIFYAIFIGALAGILIFGLTSWVISPDKRLGALLPMLIPVFLIYILIKSPNKNQGLEEVLRERGLD